MIQQVYDQSNGVNEEELPPIEDRASTEDIKPSMPPATARRVGRCIIWFLRRQQGGR